MDPVAPIDPPAPVSSAAPPSTSPIPVSDDGSVRYEPTVTDISRDPHSESTARNLHYAFRTPSILLVLSALSVFIAGCCQWMPHTVLIASLYRTPTRHWYEFDVDFHPLRMAIVSEWQTGLAFMLSLLGILLAHEMGHFVFTVFYRVRSTLPLIIPFPLSPIGTMGAVIAMEPGKANRREIFDIGIAGPLAGLVVAIPVLWYGITLFDPQIPGVEPFGIRPPPAMDWWLSAVYPTQWEAGSVIWIDQVNPYLMAGWTGLFFTGLNMFPVGQLDGGHITYCLFGRKAHWLARGLMVFSFAYMAYSGNTALILMAMLVMLMGTDHPPTSDDSVPLGWPRILLGWASLILPIVCLTPEFMVLR